MSTRPDRRHLQRGLIILVLLVCSSTSGAPQSRTSGALPNAPLRSRTSLATLVRHPDSAQRSGSRRSWLIPAVEILAFDGLLNVFDRAVLGDDYKSDLASIRRNLRREWVVDEDGYLINQLGHPIQGSIYHTFARSSQLNYWQSLGYAFTASALWEIAGETTPPSRNVQITSGIAGTFLGE